MRLPWPFKRRRKAKNGSGSASDDAASDKNDGHGSMDVDESANDSTGEADTDYEQGADAKRVQTCRKPSLGVDNGKDDDDAMDVDPPRSDDSDYEPVPSTRRRVALQKPRRSKRLRKISYDEADMDVEQEPVVQHPDDEADMDIEQEPVVQEPDDESDDSMLRKYIRERLKRLEQQRKQAKVAKNEKRAAGRRNKDGTYLQVTRPRQQEENRKQRAGQIEEFFLDQFEKIAHRHVAESEAIGDQDDAQLILDVVNAGREAMNLIPFTREDLAPILDNPQVVEFFATVIRDPLHWSEGKFMKNGTLSIQTKDTEFPAHPLIARFYIRVKPFEPTTIGSYIDKYPADLPAAVHLGYQGGVTMDNLEHHAGEAFKKHGHANIISRVFAKFRKNRVPDLQIISDKGDDDREELCKMSYVGATIATKPFERNEDDHDSHWRRVCNLENVLGQFETVYHIPALDIPVDGVLAWRTKRLISCIEETFIAIHRGLSANSALGGALPNRKPAPEVEAVVQETFVDTEPWADSITPPSNAQINLLGDMMDNETDSWDHILADDGFYTRIHPRALRAVKFDAFNMSGLVGNHTLQITIFKDITAEQLRGQIDGIRSATAGDALKQHNHLINTLYGLTLTTDKALPPEQTFSTHGPVLDFFRVTPCTEYERWTAAFTSRYLIAMNPLLLRVTSRQVGKIFLDHCLRDIWETAKKYPTKMADFIAGISSGEDLADLFPRKEQKGLTPEYQRGGEYVQQLGKLAIVPYGPQPHHIAIMCQCRHEGNLKYDPTLAPYIFDLQYAVLAKADVTARYNHYEMPAYRG